MMETEERPSDEAPRPLRGKLRLPKVSIVKMDEDTRADIRRYWRRDVHLVAFLVIPLLLAFDQGIRFALLDSWLPANLFTGFVLRPALGYLAARSLIRWMRIDWRGFGAFCGSIYAIDAAPFKVDPTVAAVVAAATCFVLFILETCFETLFTAETPSKS